MMRTMKTTRTSNPLPRHPFSPLPHPIFVTLLVCFWLALAANPAPAVPFWKDPAAGADHQQKKAPAEDFLIFGTVLNDQAFAFQGAKIEVRRAGEKKVRWRAMSDRRGEFGIRVPHGAEYDVQIEARGFAKAERKVDGKNGQRFDFVVRLQPEAAAPGKGAEKKP